MKLPLRKKCHGSCFCRKISNISPMQFTVLSKIQYQVNKRSDGSFSNHVLVLAALSEKLVPIPHHILQMRNDVLENLLSFAYTEHANLHNENYMDLLKIAEEFAIPSLKKQINEFILGSLTVENALQSYDLALEYFCETTIDILKRYILQNFSSIEDVSGHFNGMSTDLLKSFVSNNMLNVKEETLFEMISFWTANVDKGRKSLLQHVRFTHMEESFFRRNVIDADCITKQPVVQKKIHFAKDYFDEVAVMGARRRMLSKLKSQEAPRTPWEIVVAIKGWGREGPCGVVEALNVNTGRWHELKRNSLSKDLKVSYHAVEVLNDLVYIFGGYSGRPTPNYVNELYAYNPQTGLLDLKASMHERRCYLSAASMHGKIYAAGGYNGFHRSRTAEVYIPEEDRWSILPPMVEIRSDACAVAFNGRLYVIGGFNGHEIHDSIEIFDPLTNQWQFGPRMQGPRSGNKAAVYRNKIFVVGGFNGVRRLKNVEFLDPNGDNTWQPAGQLNQQRSNFALTVANDKLYAMGGYEGSGVTGSVEAYDEESNSWRPCKSMKHERSAVVAITIKGCTFDDFIKTF